MTVPLETPLKEVDSNLIRQTGRLIGLDLARAVAIFGMFWAHVSPTEETTRFLGILNEIPHGRSALLFALLAGISLALLTGRNIPYTGANMLAAKLRIVGRAIGLFVIAALLELLDHPIAVILGFYALWFLIGLFFVRWSARCLLLCGFGLALVGPTIAIVLQTVYYHFSTVGGYAPNDLINSGFITGMYPGLAYMSMVLVGMGMGRLDFSHVQRQLRWLVAGMLLASISYATSWALTAAFDTPTDPQLEKIQSLTAPEEASSLRDFYSSQLDIVNQLLPKTQTLSTEEFWQLFAAMGTFDSSTTAEVEDDGITFTISEFVTAEPHTNTTFEILGGIGVGIAVIMVCMMLTRLSIARIILWPVIAAGSMPLTIYSAHIVAFGINTDFFQSNGIAGLAWLIAPALLFAPLWLWKFKRGPLEWCLYRLSTVLARS